MGRPLVILPGVGGTRLCRRSELRRAVGGDTRATGVENRWMNLAPFRARRMQEWTDEMSVVAARHPTSGRIVGLRGSDPEIVALDGLAGVCSIVPALDRLDASWQEALDNRFQYKYFGHLVAKMAGEHGYVPGEDLLAVPYDFRLVLDPGTRAAVFEALRSRIEAAVQRTGEPAVVVAHSLGGVLAAWFLSAHASDAWAARHLHKLVCMNAPFGGTPYALRALLRGEHYLPAFASRFKAGLRLNSGVLMSLPNQPLACAERLTAADVAALAESLEARAALYEPAALWVGADVAVDVVTSVGVETMTRFRADTGAATAGGEGDGLVPAASLEAAFQVFGGPRVARLCVEGSNHVGVVGDPRLLRHIAKQCLS